jgi:short subunit dehydrogenase-like uncharacterized protein
VKSTNWLIYGANGYTARRIAKEAVARGLKPILAGRNEASVGELAKSLGLSYRIFSLDNVEVVKAGLKDVALVLHCAGPFSETIHPMLEACFALGVHYLDITGEIDVFEWAQTQSEKAVSSGSVVIPGVGFDVVPSDCLAASLAKALPGATTLELAFASDTPFGPGALKTAVKIFPQGGKVRRDGKIVPDVLGGRTREIPFSHRKLWAVSIPWGDVSTAYHSTKIPNITVFAAFPKKMMVLIKVMNPFRSVFRINAMQKLAEKGIERFAKGSDEKTWIHNKSYLWGEISDSKNHQKRGVLECSEAYVLEVDCALKSVERVLAGKVKPGVWTPSQAFGASFIEEIPGSRLQIQQ